MANKKIELIRDVPDLVFKKCLFMQIPFNSAGFCSWASFLFIASPQYVTSLYEPSCKKTNIVVTA